MVALGCVLALLGAVFLGLIVGVPLAVTAWRADRVAPTVEEKGALLTLADLGLPETGAFTARTNGTASDAETRQVWYSGRNGEVTIESALILYREPGRGAWAVRNLGGEGRGMVRHADLEHVGGRRGRAGGGGRRALGDHRGRRGGLLRRRSPR